MFKVYGGLDASLSLMMHGVETDWIEEEMSDDDDFRYVESSKVQCSKFMHPILVKWMRLLSLTFLSQAPDSNLGVLKNQEKIYQFCTPIMGTSFKQKIIEIGLLFIEISCPKTYLY